MPLDPTKLKAGDVVRFHRHRVTVLAVNRFWNRAGELIAGAVMIDGDPLARTPRSLRAFCAQAGRPRK